MSEPIINKHCSKCKQIKPVSEFYTDTRVRDGYRSECKSCHNITILKYQNTEKGKAVKKATQKRYSQSEKSKIVQKRYAQSKKGKTVQKRSNQSKKGRAAKRRYNQSEKGKIAIKRYYIRHPERIRARGVVNQAIKEGKLPHLNTLKCACDNQAEHYHHWHGYAIECQLDVIPVCSKCHSRQSQSS